MIIKLPTYVESALCALREKGFEAYVVGGCVRDSLLGRTPGDWDITTNALPGDIQRIFSSYMVIPTGIQHGTVTVIIQDTPLEITTYRVDGAYTDNRHPDTISFSTSLREDTLRRDFTINAMAYSPDCGIIDYHSGLADLADGRIACVGDPEKRFTEDALRILRAIRFSSVLDFPLEKVTASAAKRLSPLLHNVSAERIACELIKLLCGKGVRRVLLEYADILCVVLPELHPTFSLQQENPYHHLTVYEHTVETVSAVPAEPVLRLAMLFHDLGKPACYTRDSHGIDHFRGHPAISTAIAEQIMTRLRLDKTTVSAVCRLVLHHDDTLSMTDSALKRLLHRFGVQDTHRLVAIQKADVIGQHPDKLDRLSFLASIDKRLDELVEEGACFSLRSLAIDGHDLQSLGYHGRLLGDTLERLLDDVMDGKLPNEKTALLNAAAKWL